ncbi:hypothetical protein ALC60_08891 [Trachymyrmex zeteki]|uniref:Uncharacterized protein n=1 Tax=Mycetomoellerius zeteki TaxID=64791 RepID=A0A151WWE1_9HYME|nr:hypothetical protein ALC60_08891 [Trachymyrmex zeteki]
MFLIISDDLHSLTSKELEYIPKIILLREFENFIDVLWDRLPKHIRANLEIQRYRRCLKHYNLGLLNRTINALPFELHIPGYQFCGPRTRLEKQLARGDRGINPLDAACREHDIAYSHSSELAKRHTSDNLLAEKARKRIVARDSTLGERAAAKTKLGMGLKTRKRKSKRILSIVKRGGVLPIHPLPCDSFLYVEGRLTLKKKDDDAPTTLGNNCVAFMFDEMRYELNGVEIDRNINVGVTSTLNNYVSLTYDKSLIALNACL